MMDAMNRLIVVAAVLVVVGAGVWGQRAQTALGIFEGHDDVGSVLTAGSAEYDPAKKVLALVGSGENMWFTKDEFQFVWKKISGDFTLTADIVFPDSGGNAHKKAVLMARQSLDTDSVYADAAVHGDGLTSLQSRAETGANTHEVGINAAHPRSVRLEKHGDDFFMSLDGKFSGASMKVALKAPFYVGLGVCSHDKDAVAKALFSNVSLTEETAKPGSKMQRYSTLEKISVTSTDRRVERVDSPPVDAPSSNGGEGYAAFDDLVNCFPRVSPDGFQVAVLSYAKGTVACPADVDVQLRIITLADRKIRMLAKFKGGLGTLGPAPWSPDGKSLEFVSFQEIPKND